jgi:hypothetical protein
MEIETKALGTIWLIDMLGKSWLAVTLGQNDIMSK